LVALAVALVATGGLSAAYAVTLVGSTSSYLVVARHIDAGAKITDSDLSIARISSDPLLKPIPATRRANVVGKYAVVELFPGGLLGNDQVGDVPLGGSGTYLVSIGLSPSKVPAQRVKPGTNVVLVATPAQTFVQNQQPTTGPPQTFAGVVADVSTNDNQNGFVYVNVAVAQADGATVATLAAAERLVIVLAGA
jgi:flagella basal body P-ring formation protein FlgA